MVFSESRSGFGSTLEYTENARMHVPVVLARFSIATYLLRARGDFNWMRFCIETPTYSIREPI